MASMLSPVQLSSPAAIKAVPPALSSRFTRFGRSVPLLGSCAVRAGNDCMTASGAGAKPTHAH